MSKFSRCSLYVRRSGSRRYEWVFTPGKPEPKTFYSMDTIFVLRYERDGKRVWETIDAKSYQEAKLAAMRKEIDLFTGEQTPVEKRSPANQTVSLDIAVEQYLKELRDNRRPEKSVKSKQTELTEFLSFTKARTLQELKRADLITYRNHLYDEGYAPVTVLNKLMSVVTFLKKNPEVSITRLLKAEDWPEKPETEPNPYTDEELRAMMEAATPDERLLIRFFLGTGMRDQEVAHTELSDIKDTYIQVQPKPKYGWSPKTAAGTRKIPLGDGLLADLRDHCSSGLLFPNPTTGRPEGHFLRIIQRIAARAAVQGAGCHRFRDTFATEQVRARVLDLRDIAKIMGHENLEMMKLYAAFIDLKSAQARRAANVSDRFGAKPQLVKTA